jgi:hypothetical protein
MPKRIIPTVATHLRATQVCLQKPQWVSSEKRRPVASEPRQEGMMSTWSTSLRVPRTRESASPLAT